MQSRIDAPNAALVRHLAHVMDVYEQQQAAMDDVVQQLAECRAAATSADRLATVTVNAAGAVVDVELARTAFRETTPERLARSIAAAAADAALSVRRRAEAISAPVTAAANEILELSHEIPGAADLRDLQDSLTRGLGEALLPQPRELR
ncbi:MAG: YbaB/EbfC family nucleoid-associated protein [Streptomycetaceae bacterium]|nr:YbaB/EbfC family nucleoid-associated protein [Streptomycetaceae bacterium]